MVLQVLHLEVRSPREGVDVHLLVLAAADEEALPRAAVAALQRQ